MVLISRDGRLPTRKRWSAARDEVEGGDRKSDFRNLAGEMVARVVDKKLRKVRRQGLQRIEEGLEGLVVDVPSSETRKSSPNRECMREHLCTHMTTYGVICWYLYYSLDLIRSHLTKHLSSTICSSIPITCSTVPTSPCGYIFWPNSNLSEEPSNCTFPSRSHTFSTLEQMVQ